MNAVIKAVNRAYDRVETRPFWKTRLIAIVLVVLTGLVLAGLLLLIVFGGPLGTAIADKAGLGGAFELLWAILRWPIAFVAILLFFGLVYYLAPNLDVRSWKWLTPGSLVGSLMWLVLSGLFALYTSLSDSYSKTYGALASGIVLLLWLNYSAFALLFGAELNAELDRQAEIRAAGGKNAGLVKPSRRASASVTLTEPLTVFGLLSEKKRSGPAESLTFHVSVPIPARPDLRLTPLPTRWKLCSFERSRTVIE